MSRRRKVYKKEEHVDSRYGSRAVARLISTVMKRGKKSLAERIVYTAIDKSREGSDSVDPLEVLNKALENVRPRLEVKSHIRSEEHTSELQSPIDTSIDTLSLTTLFRSDR